MNATAWTYCAAVVDIDLYEHCTGRTEVLIADPRSRLSRSINNTPKQAPTGAYEISK
jgi:hypothetical protein